MDHKGDLCSNDPHYYQACDKRLLRLSLFPRLSRILAAQPSLERAQWADSGDIFLFEIGQCLTMGILVLKSSNFAWYSAHVTQQRSRDTATTWHGTSTVLVPCHVVAVLPEYHAKLHDFKTKIPIVKHCPISKRKISLESAHWALSKEGCAAKIRESREKKAKP